VKEAFAATELFRGTGSAGGIHAEVRIGDSMVMIGGAGTWNGEPIPAAIYLCMDFNNLLTKIYRYSKIGE
jgi:PhnB protein